MADVASAAIVTEGETVADLELLVNLTVSPPVGAAALNLTVPVTVVPPGTDSEFNVSEVRIGGLIVIVTVLVTVPALAVITTDFAVVTPFVVAVNPIVSWPAATVTDLGTTTAALLEDSVTTNPVEAALPVRLTVPADETPPVTVEGVTLTRASTAGVTVRVAVAVTLFSDAVTVAVLDADTPEVVTVNVPESAPAAMMTEAGTVATVPEIDRATVVPPAPAAPVRVTVPVELEPPPTEAGFRVTETRVAGVRVSGAVFDPVVPAVILTTVVEFTPLVVTVNVAVVAPEAMSTVAGTTALTLSEKRGVAKPPVGAVAESVTVP